jgi:chromosome segregation protein
LEARAQHEARLLAEEQSRFQTESAGNKRQQEIATQELKESTEQHRTAQEQIKQARERESQLAVERAKVQQDLGAALELQQELQTNLEQTNQSLRQEQEHSASQRQELESRLEKAEERLEQERTAIRASLDASRQESASARAELDSIWGQIESLSQARNRAAAERDHFKMACEEAQAQLKPDVTRLATELEKAQREHQAAMGQVVELTKELTELRNRLAHPVERATEQHPAEPGRTGLGKTIGRFLGAASATRKTTEEAETAKSSVRSRNQRK